MITVSAKNTVKKPVKLWLKPCAEEMRFGFEITMYILNR